MHQTFSVFGLLLCLSSFQIPLCSWQSCLYILLSHWQFISLLNHSEGDLVRHIPTVYKRIIPPHATILVAICCLPNQYGQLHFEIKIPFLLFSRFIWKVKMGHLNMACTLNQTRIETNYLLTVPICLLLFVLCVSILLVGRHNPSYKVVSYDEVTYLSKKTEISKEK